jgi:hypothetical protein
MFARMFAFPMTERNNPGSMGVCGRGCGCCNVGCAGCEDLCGVGAADVGAEAWDCGGQLAGRKGLAAPVPRAGGGTDEGRGIAEGG